VNSPHLPNSFRQRNGPQRPREMKADEEEKIGELCAKHAITPPAKLNFG